MSDRLFFTDEHDLLRQSIREFVEKELDPYAEQWEAEGLVPRSVFERMGELGFLGLHFPEEFGGGGGDYFTNIVLLEELARCQTYGVNTGIAVQVGMATPPPSSRSAPRSRNRSTWSPRSRARRLRASASPSPEPGPTFHR